MGLPLLICLWAKVSWKKDVIKIREAITELDIRETLEKMNTAKIWIFERINKIDKPFIRLVKKNNKRENIYHQE